MKHKETKITFTAPECEGCRHRHAQSILQYCEFWYVDPYKTKDVSKTNPCPHYSTQKE